jgi:predicted RNA binding protein YcfA (HicA-like mRNA interferase family)
VTRFPVVSGRETIRALERVGFQVVDQEGSHVKLKRFAPEKTHITIVPLHRELARKTLMSILKQGGLTVEEFRELL